MGLAWLRSCSIHSFCALGQCRHSHVFDHHWAWPPGWTRVVTPMCAPDPSMFRKWGLTTFLALFLIELVWLILWWWRKRMNIACCTELCKSRTLILQHLQVLIIQMSSAFNPCWWLGIFGLHYSQWPFGNSGTLSVCRSMMIVWL